MFEIWIVLEKLIEKNCNKSFKMDIKIIKI